MKFAIIPALIISGLLQAADIIIPGYPPIPNPTDLGDRAALLLFMENEMKLVNLDGLSRQELIDIYKITTDAKRQTTKEKTSKPSVTIEPEPDENIPGVQHGQLLSKDAILINKAGQAIDKETLRGKNFILLYFSAHWCPPCRAFTPKLVNYYNKNSETKDFTVLFVSSDRSSAEMNDYMQLVDMPWPGYKWGSPKSRDLSQFYDIRSIPYLMVLDKNDNVLLDSMENGNYIGPDAVLQKFDRIRKE